MIAELKELTKPTKVVTLAFTVLFTITAFFAGTFVNNVMSNDTKALAAISQLEKDKLDKAVYEKQCDVFRVELERKAGKGEVDVLQRRTDQILSVLLEPNKRDVIRNQFEAERLKK